MEGTTAPDEVLVADFDNKVRAALMEDVDKIDSIVRATGLCRTRVYEMAEGSFYPTLEDAKTIGRILDVEMTETPPDE